MVHKKPLPHCWMAMSAEHRSQFCSPSLVMVTSPYELIILKWDENQNKRANKQNNVWSFVLESERVTWSKIMVVLLIGICS